MQIVIKCQGYNPSDTPSIDRVFVNCGYLMPPPVPTSGSSSTADVDQVFTRPIYVCASALQASIKQTSFLYNDTGGTPSLSNLEVVNVAPKVYSRKEDIPVWGVENPGPTWNISTIQLLWGIVDGAKYNTSSTLWVVQKDRLYLPSFSFDSLGYDDAMVSRFHKSKFKAFMETNTSRAHLEAQV
jgi:hypothetical protein